MEAVEEKMFWIPWMLTQSSCPNTQRIRNRSPKYFTTRPWYQECVWFWHWLKPGTSWFGQCCPNQYILVCFRPKSLGSSGLLASFIESLISITQSWLAAYLLDCFEAVVHTPNWTLTKDVSPRGNISSMAVSYLHSDEGLTLSSHSPQHIFISEF